jgi:hypothetical protein
MMKGGNNDCNGGNERRRRRCMGGSNYCVAMETNYRNNVHLLLMLFHFWLLDGYHHVAVGG